MRWDQTESGIGAWREVFGVSLLCIGYGQFELIFSECPLADING